VSVKHGHHHRHYHPRILLHNYVRLWLPTLNSSGSSSSSGGGSIVLEYKSSGKGFFAKGFNGGKPFVDDLIVESSGNGTFEFRSSSRIGDSDFGVNSKRLSYIGGLLKGKGWNGLMLTN
jgi:hypothetical protein